VLTLMTEKAVNGPNAGGTRQRSTSSGNYL
jgi:hypothetical protein